MYICTDIISVFLKLTFIPRVALTPVSQAASVGETHAVATVVLGAGWGLLVAEGEGEGPLVTSVQMYSPLVTSPVILVVSSRGLLVEAS